MAKPVIPRLEIAVEAGDWPEKAALRALLRKAVAAAVGVLAEADWGASEVSILFTDDEAMRALNAQWRGIDKPTNVLSFPASPSGLRRGSPGPSPQEGGEPVPLGDIALAAETVAREAALAEKPIEDHIAHLIVHGFFHLLGYDHQVEEEADTMEAMERAALGTIGMADPYRGSS